jgi:histidine triad (HIT) family protein
MYKEDCIFCKIVKGDIKADIILETDDYVAFKDINPQAAVHVLIIPKSHYDSLNELDDTGLIGRLVEGARSVAEKLGVKDNGYRLVLNTGKKAGQEVFHIHFHLLAGRPFSWPPG